MKCLLCGSSHRKIFEHVESFGFPLVYYHCDQCGLIYQSLKESRASDPEFYRHVYRKIYQTQEEPTEKDLWVQNKRAAHLIQIIEDQVGANPGRVLDIGASAGVLLDQIRQVFASEVIGVEPGDAYRAYAEQSGIEMKESLNALLASSPGKFDLICMSHVLEHLSEPVRVLDTIREELLNKDGHLLVEVPNFFAHDSYELAHLSCFTPHTLGEVLKQAGFNLVFIKMHGIPRSKLLNLYITSISKISHKSREARPVRKDNFVRIKRDFSMLYRRILQKVFPHKAWLPISVIDKK